MNFITNLLSKARGAWDLITFVPRAIASALAAIWHYITSVHDLFAYIIRIPLIGGIIALVDIARLWGALFGDMLAMIRRIAAWVDAELVEPLRRQLLKLLAQLAAKEAADVRRLIADDIEDLRLAMAYTDLHVGIERKERIADVKAARAYALKLVTAALALVQHEAASAYNATLPDRLGVIQKILDELAVRNPAVRALVADLIKGVIDLVGVENPVARLALTLVLRHIIDRLGVDKAAGDLAQRLLGPLAGQPKPKTLHDVILDIGHRLTAVEDQWSQFMVDGGPEVEQAGQEWKALTSVLGDAALLGMFGLAVADPTAWARGVADTLGVVANDSMIGVIDLIRRA